MSARSSAPPVMAGLALAPPALLAVGVLLGLDLDFYETTAGYVGWMGTVFLTPLLGLAAVALVAVAAGQDREVTWTQAVALVAGLLAVGLGLWAFDHAQQNVWPT